MHKDVVAMVVNATRRKSHVRKKKKGRQGKTQRVKMRKRQRGSYLITKKKYETK
jgi:hypothetical protein